MTQLGELQDALPRFREAGIQLYAVSYDDHEAQAAFAKARGIEYPLLSDPDSAVIRAYGILNTLVREDEVPFYGIPVPGTYLIDEDGIVTEKFFPRHLANRESADTVLDSALGEILRSEDDPSASGGDDDVRITAFLRGGPIKGGPVRRLIVRFELRDGLHICGPPVPDGMVATQIEIDGPDGLHVEAPITPPAEPLRLEALGAELQVWSGTVDIAIPIWADSKIADVMNGIGSDRIALDVRVRYQACDDRTCLIPRTETLRVEVPVEPLDVPDLPPLSSTGQRVTTMKSLDHFRRLAERQRRASD